MRFRVRLDPRPPRVSLGIDVDEAGNGTIAEQRMYRLVRQSGPITDRTFEIELLDSGVAACALTYC